MQTILVHKAAVVNEYNGREFTVDDLQKPDGIFV